MNVLPSSAVVVYLFIGMTLAFDLCVLFFGLGLRRAKFVMIMQVCVHEKTVCVH